MDQKDYERLAKLETQLENLTTLVVELKAQISSFTQNFPTRLEVNEMFRSRDQDIQETREEIKTMRVEMQTLKSEQQNDKRASAAQVASWISIVVGAMALVVSLFK